MLPFSLSCMSLACGWGGHANSTQTGWETNLQPSCCVATALTTALPCHPLRNVLVDKYKFLLSSSVSMNVSCSSLRALNVSQLQALGIEMMPDYKDPYSGRILTRGEIGCFLSHHSIWTQVKAAVDKSLLFFNQCGADL